MTGPVKPEEGYKDLLKVIEAIDPTSTPTEVSLTKIREDSITFVRQGAEKGWWSKWEDYHLLIEGHDSEDEPAEEGMEAFGAEPHDDAENDEDSVEDDQEGAAADGGADDGSQPSPDGDDSVSDDETNYSQTSAEKSDDDADDGHGGGGVEGVSTVPVAEAPLPGSEVSSGSQPSSEVLSSEAARAKAELDALKLLFDAAVRNRDDAGVKFFRNRIAGKDRDVKEGASEAGILLRKRALEQHQEDLKSAKRYKEEERIAAREEQNQKIREQQQEEALRRERRLMMEQKLANKKYEDEKRIAKFRAKEYQCWLQTKFPAELADRCISVFKAMTKSQKKQLEQNVYCRWQTREFDRFRVIPELWKWDKTLTTHWFSTTSYNGGSGSKSIQCGEPFLAIIDRYAPQRTVKVPQAMLMTLLEQCVPHAKKVFAGNYEPMKLLHINDYVIEKTFVYAMICLSKFLGPDWFSWGVFQWPPAPPPNIYASNPDIVPVPDLDAMPEAASASGLPVHLRLPPTPA